MISASEMKPKLNPDWSLLKKYLDEDVNDPKYKWQKARDDGSLSVYKKFESNHPYPIVKIKAVFKNMKADILAKRILDINLISKWDIGKDNVYDDAKLVEQLNANEDIFYLVTRAPTPVCDRDFIQYRSYFCNKLHPELVRKYNFYETNRKYWACYVHTL